MVFWNGSVWARGRVDGCVHIVVASRRVERRRRGRRRDRCERGRRVSVPAEPHLVGRRVQPRGSLVLVPGRARQSHVCRRDVAHLRRRAGDRLWRERERAGRGRAMLSERIRGSATVLRGRTDLQLRRLPRSMHGPVRGRRGGRRCRERRSRRLTALLLGHEALPAKTRLSVRPRRRGVADLCRMRR